MGGNENEDTEERLMEGGRSRMRKHLLHFLHPTFPRPGESGILKETRTIWEWSWRSRTKGSGATRNHFSSPVSLSLSFSSSFLCLSLSPPSDPPHTHTPCFCSPPVLCNYRSSCLEHCLPRASFRPLLKRYAFSETFPELE